MSYVVSQNFNGYNTQAISARVAEVLSKLKKGHNRSEAFKAINDANIFDTRGKRIIPSVWYHSLCYVVKISGKTYMEENFPKFVPTESPYARPKMERVRPNQKVNLPPVHPVSDSLAILKTISATLIELKGIVDSIHDNHNQLVESVDSLKQEMSMIQKKLKITPSKKNEANPVKDNAIHASIHSEDKDIGVKDSEGNLRAA